MKTRATKNSRARVSSHRYRRGFTLVELLVVMGIILVLISILLPAVNRAHLQAVRTSMMGDFAVISQALDAYRNDFGDYPRTGLGTSTSNGSPGSQVGVTGAAVLCWALVGPGPASQDGAGATSGTDYGAPGFRPHLASQGKVYGPYISLDRFRIGTVAVTTTNPTNNTVNPVASGQYFDDTTCVLADRYGNVILYFPANTQVSPTSTGLVGQWTIGTTGPPTSIQKYGVYNYSDNSSQVVVTAGTYPAYISTTANPGQSTLTARIMAYRLGHNAALSSGNQGIGPVSPGEVPVVVPYLLWSAGPDNQFGPQVNTNGTTTGEDDDVVYPDQLNTVPAGMTP